MGGFYKTNSPASMPTPAAYCAPAYADEYAPSAAAVESCYHYNPYDTECSRVLCHPAGYVPSYPEAPQEVLPFGTLHTCLEGRVSFVPYPAEEFYAPETPVSKDNLVRVFIGQLPYQVTDMQLDWLCYTFGNGHRVYYPERITKHDNLRGCKVPTGCIHAYCDGELAAEMLNSMHKRILVDDTGVWFAESPEQQAALNDYCQLLKIDRTRRFQNRPYDTVVAQFATSSYVPTSKRR